jgi:hypothetical protein
MLYVIPKADTFCEVAPLSGGAIFFHITQLKDVKLIEIALNA